ncbi:hypothetical protein [Fimbriiglobus ruber]|nr:hypothetical protein [Fimbriiglobus ruber]
MQGNIAGKEKPRSAGNRHCGTAVALFSLRRAAGDRGSGVLKDWGAKMQTKQVERSDAHRKLDAGCANRQIGAAQSYNFAALLAKFAKKGKVTR